MAAEIPIPLGRALTTSVFADLSSGAEKTPRPYSTLHLHNIGAVVGDVDSSVGDVIDGIYSLRGGAFDPTSPQVGIVVKRRTPQVEAQADYVAGVLHRSREMGEYVVATYADLRQRNDGTTLVAPYLNTDNEQRRIEETGQISYGLPPRLVKTLNNKASFHRLVDQMGIDSLEVPTFGIARIDDGFESTANRVLNRSRRLYDTYGFSGRYPLGMMFRTAESSGQYGSARAVETAEGEIETVLYGETPERETFSKEHWREALDHIKRGMTKNLADPANTEVVISRYIQVADSPGLAFFINGGHIMPLQWNKQIMKKGDTSCKGTMLFSSEDTAVNVMQRVYEGQSQALCATLIEQAAKQANIPLPSLRGTVSLDLMLPGPLELDLLRAQGRKVLLYLAECNARLTNRTRGVLEAMGIMGATHVMDATPSVANMARVTEFGVESRDAFPLHGANPSLFRDNVRQMDERVAPDGKARAFVSMLTPDSDSAGVLLLGDSRLGKRILVEARDSALTQAA